LSINITINDELLIANIFAFFIDNNKCYVYIVFNGQVKRICIAAKIDNNGVLIMVFRGGFMKEKGSIVKLVFGCINEVVSTTENIHREIVEKTAGASASGFEDGGRRKQVYDTIKAVNSKVEDLLSDPLNSSK
jgi:hypothetical protein